jgi:hypothetical protein
VFTSRSLPMGSALHMTYGAKGNASLLGRYGFAIPNNVEPDGETPPPRAGCFCSLLRSPQKMKCVVVHRIDFTFLRFFRLCALIKGLVMIYWKSRLKRTSRPSNCREVPSLIRTAHS